MNEALVHSVTLDCSVAHAFQVFTQQVDLWWPKGHRRFEESSLQHDVRVGGKLIEQAANGERFVLADIVAIEPPHQIELAWHPGKLTNPTRTLVTFSADGAHRANVVVTHSEGHAAMGDAWPQRAALFDKGWNAVLAALDDFIKLEDVKNDI